MAPSLNAAQYSESPELCASGHRKKKGGAIEECQPAARGIPSEMYYVLMSCAKKFTIQSWVDMKVYVGAQEHLKQFTACRTCFKNNRH